jgi:hypothetical protein
MAAGLRETLDVGTLVLAALAGRAIRFYLLSGILFMFGGTARRALERSLVIVPVIMLVLLVLGYVVGTLFL